MFARCAALAMNIAFIFTSLIPLDRWPTFSPAREPTWQPRSSVGPLVCEMKPCAAIRAPFWAAIAARHAFHRSAGRPAAARSWLIELSWPVPIATAGRAAGAAHVVGVVAGDMAIGAAADG